eukprot:CAMPEP_0168625656 /NCGR_PEP_ID=MMETSP0449_2-20121227/10152_1 /TAXON_ID=1082188 /ORGANISM="Strombidium rassoulzadegani, Strain ras09" /LENGTH=42 /DNA_ID= /DNA_START= /DNA_END= /DNA_ORIENTATION=
MINKANNPQNDSDPSPPPKSKKGSKVKAKKGDLMEQEKEAHD